MSFFRCVSLSQLCRFPNPAKYLLGCIQPMIQDLSIHSGQVAELTQGPLPSSVQMDLNATIQGTEWRGHQFKNIRLSGYLYGISINNCTFENVKFDHVIFDRCKFGACEFNECEFNQVKFLSSSFQQTLFNHVTGNTVGFLDCKLSNRILETFVLIMSDQSISAQSWQNVNLKRVDFRGRQLSGVDFSGAKLAGAIFDFATLIGSRFIETNLQGASFRKANLIYTQFQNSKLQGAILTDAIFSYASFAGAKLIGVTIENQSDLSPISLQKGVIFNSADLSGSKIRNLHLVESYFLSARMAEGHWQSVLMLDCIANNLHCENSIFWRVCIRGGDLNNAIFFNCNWRNFKMIQCQFRNASLQFSQLDDGYIWHSNFDEARITGSLFFALLYGVRFLNSTLDSVSFKQSHLHYVNFVGAKGVRVNFIQTKLMHVNFSQDIKSLVVSNKLALQRLFNSHYTNVCANPVFWMPIFNMLAYIECLHDGYAYKDALYALLEKGIESGFFNEARSFYNTALRCEVTSQLFLLSDLLYAIQKVQLLWHPDVYPEMCSYFLRMGLNQDTIELILRHVLVLKGAGLGGVNPERIGHFQWIDYPNILM